MYRIDGKRCLTFTTGEQTECSRGRFSQPKTNGDEQLINGVPRKMEVTSTLCVSFQSLYFVISFVFWIHPRSVTLLPSPWNLFHTKAIYCSRPKQYLLGRLYFFVSIYSLMNKMKYLAAKKVGEA